MEIYNQIKVDIVDAFTKAGISEKDQMWNQGANE